MLAGALGFYNLLSTKIQINAGAIAEDCMDAERSTDGNVFKLRIWCGFPAGYMLAQKSHPNPPMHKLNPCGLCTGRLGGGFRQ